jgi:hypothetical protein
MKKYFLLFVSFLLASLSFAQNKTALFPFPNEKGRWGYVDAQKNVKIAYQFLGASPFYEERAFIARQEAGKTEPIVSVIDITGKVLFDVNIAIGQPHEICQMSHTRYSEGLLGISSYDDNVPNKFIDKEGKTVLTLPKDKYNIMALNPFFNGLTYIPLENAYLYIDKTGKEVLKGKSLGMPIDYNFSEGWAIADFGTMEKNEYQFINTKGEKAPFLKKIKNITDLGAFSEGMAFVSYMDTDNTFKIVLLKTDGTTIPVDALVGNSSPVTTVSGYKFSNGLALVQTGDDMSMQNPQYLNKQGKIAFQLPKAITDHKKEGYTMISGTNFHQGLACWVVQTGETT